MIPSILLGLAGLILLGGGVAFGYRRWIKPQADDLDFQEQGLLLLIILTMSGGFIGSFFWWFDLAQSFSWDLPPLASRMLAAAGWSFAVACYSVLQRPDSRRVRIILLMLFVYLFPLVIAILRSHLNRFDFSAPITYVFLVIAVGMTLATTWYLLRQPTLVFEQPADRTRSSPVMEAWLRAIAVLMAVWGGALFFTDSGPYSWMWVWPGDLLTSRLIAVMLLTIATGAGAALGSANASRTMLAVTVTYGLGVAAANLWSVIGGKEIKLAYVIVFGIIAFGSAVMMRRTHAPVASPGD